MVASLLRLLHSGVQDARLLPPKGQPALDMFKKVFIKAGRFTTQWVRLEFDQTPDFGKSVSITLPRQGHLITRLYIVANFPDIVDPQLAARTAAGSAFLGPTFGWTNSLGHVLIQTTQLDIGGTRVEVLDSRLLEVLDEFHTPLEKVPLVNKLIERYDHGFTVQTIGWNRPARVAVPIPFWFSRGDIGAALPIDALSADQVKMTVQFAPLNELYVSQPISVLPSPTAVGADVQSPCKQYSTLLNSGFYQQTNDVTTPIENIKMPNALSLGETYVMVEYVYLDKAEANRFRLSDIQLPIPQHYAFAPYETNGFPHVSIPLRVSNPTRDLYFFAQRIEAPLYNAPFLATRDLSDAECPNAPWWPDASGLESRYFTGTYLPAFTLRESDPILDIALIYEGRLVRYGASASALFRSIMPSFQQRKTPWVNKYYYTLSFGLQHGFLPPSLPSGEANLDKIRRVSLELSFTPTRGSNSASTIPQYKIYIWAETYNILRIYGGRAALMFAY